MPDLSKRLFVQYVESTPYWSENAEPDYFETITVFLPKYIVRQVPHYESKLDVELAKLGYNEDDLIIIEDDHTRNKLVYNHAIKSFASGVLAKLDGSRPTCKKALKGLTLLYGFSIEMHARKLEMAVNKHIDDFKDLAALVFLKFDHDYYKSLSEGNDHDSEKDSLSLLIKKKLAKFLPHIIEFKMIQEI